MNIIDTIIYSLNSYKKTLKSFVLFLESAENFKERKLKKHKYFTLIHMIHAEIYSKNSLHEILGVTVEKSTSLFIFETPA